MIRKNIKFIIIAICMFSVCACSNKNTASNSKYNILEFKVDSNTVRETPLTDNKTNSYVKVEYGELVIKGEDKEQSYEIVDNSHIKYKNVLYKNLYTYANQMETPNDKVTFINFIIKTYEPISDTVTTILVSDSRELSEGNNEYSGDSKGESIKDSLNTDWGGYKALRDRYGEDIKYQLIIFEGASEHMAMIYSCNKYMLYRGNSSNMTVDMNKINGGN